MELTIISVCAFIVIYLFGLIWGMYILIRDGLVRKIVAAVTYRVVIGYYDLKFAWQFRTWFRWGKKKNV